MNLKAEEMQSLCVDLSFMQDDGCQSGSEVKDGCLCQTDPQELTSSYVCQVVPQVPQKSLQKLHRSEQLLLLQLSCFEAIFKLNSLSQLLIERHKPGPDC